MKNKNLLFIFVCLFTTFAHAGLPDLLHTDPWEFMQEKFITTPKARARKIMPMIAKAVTGVTSGYAAWETTNFLLKKLSDKLRIEKNYSEETKISISKLIKFLISPTTSILVGCMVFSSVHNLLVSHYQNKELMDLLNNWQELKPLVPSNLQPAFEKIYNEYIANPNEFADKSDDIIRIITNQINEKFSSKASGKFWEAKLFDGHIIFDIANKIGSITKIFQR